MSSISLKRIVIKVGSALIAPKQNGCSSHYLLGIAQFIVRCKAMGIEVVLVSSGSVAAGSHLFNEQEAGYKPSIAVKKSNYSADQGCFLNANRVYEISDDYDNFDDIANRYRHQKI